MNVYNIRILPLEKQLSTSSAGTLMEILRSAGLHLDAPCGGRGTCGKCKVWVDGSEVLACRTKVDRDMTVVLPHKQDILILADGLAAECQADGAYSYVLAFDIGTTTVVAYLLDGKAGTLLSQASCLNPQTVFGADVISRIQHAITTQSTDLHTAIVTVLGNLTRQVAADAGIDPEQIGLAAVVGNTAMHHLFLGINPKSLTIPPYMPTVSSALELPAAEYFPIAPDGVVRVLPNIAGFVGADTVGCMTATRFDRVEKLTLMIDIGTNGEMVLGDRKRRLACSAAAGPAFEGARISCGMRGVEGAVDHVRLEDGAVKWHVIGGGKAVGLCGSGLLELVAVLLDTGYIAEEGYMPAGAYHLDDTDVVLTQKDVREVQLAKAAIRAGIELMCEYLNTAVEEIHAVYLAGAFGNYLDANAACRIGMIPLCLIDRIQPIGNAAGAGAKLCALSRVEYDYSKSLAAGTEFLELASLPQFQDRFVDCLSFKEEADNG